MSSFQNIFFDQVTSIGSKVTESFGSNPTNFYTDPLTLRGKSACEVQLTLYHTIRIRFWI